MVFFKFWFDLILLFWIGCKFGLVLKVLFGFKNRFGFKFCYYKIFGLNFIIIFLYLFDDFIDFLYCLCLIYIKYFI